MLHSFFLNFDYSPSNSGHSDVEPVLKVQINDSRLRQLPDSHGKISKLGYCFLMLTSLSTSLMPCVMNHSSHYNNLVFRWVPKDDIRPGPYEGPSVQKASG